MPALAERGALAAVADEAAARATLRAQIARLEHALASVGPLAPPRAGAVAPGPRLLDLGELERVRDALAQRLRAAQAAEAARAAERRATRALIDAMLADPAAHKWRRITVSDLDAPGCRTYHVRPRLGLIGMLAGWWEVRLSSGCP